MPRLPNEMPPHERFERPPHEEILGKLERVEETLRRIEEKIR